MPLARQLRILLVINPSSGSGDRQQLEQSVREYFRHSDHQTEYYELTGEHDDASINYWIENWHPDRVVAAGGDGTVKAVATIMMGKDIPLGILPAGSANGMAKELGIPDTPEACLDIITGDYTSHIDLIRINDEEICLHLSDLGLNAKLVKHFEEHDRRGMWGYAKEVWRVMRHREQFQIKVDANDKTVRRRAWMVVIANARMYGTGATINPNGNVSDGLLEIIVLRRLSIWELLKMLVKNRRFDPRKTEIIQTSAADIAVTGTAHFQVDGEYRDTVKNVRATVLPGALLMLLPNPRKTA